jgi:hypothetical protein
MRRRDFIAGLMFAAAMGRAQAQQNRLGKFTGSHSLIPRPPLPISLRRAEGPS